MNLFNYSLRIYVTSDKHGVSKNVMSDHSEETVSRLEYHVLLAMAEGPRYGYAIKSAVESDSQGALEPRAGTLYRVIARLMTRAFVEEVDPPADTPPHPGRTRKYYGLTREGRTELVGETRRLHGVAALADERLGVVKGRP